MITDHFLNTIIAVTVIPLVIEKGTNLVSFFIQHIVYYKVLIWSWLFPSTEICVPEIFRITSNVFNNNLYKALMWKCGECYKTDPKCIKFGVPFYFASPSVNYNESIIKEYRNFFKFCLFYEGHKLEITHSKSEAPAYFNKDAKLGKNLGPQMKLATTDEMQFKISLHGCQDRTKIDTFIESTLESFEKMLKEQQKQVMYIITSPTDVVSSYTKFQVQFSHLLLDADLKSKIKSELDGFYSTKIKAGLPNRLGLMLCGLPGCGKTSLIKAIAREYSIDIFKINSFQPPLATESKSKYIQDVFDNMARHTNTIGNRSMWLFEDIDCLLDCVQDRKNSSSSHVNDGLSAVLNSLDGVLTPNEILIVFTSNRPSILDPALVRPGRIDRVFSLGHVFDPKLLNEFCLHFLSEEQIDSNFFNFVKENQLTPSMVASILRSTQRTNSSLIKIAQTLFHERKSE